MYKALYRKWRPLTFDDVVSQHHITETLKNQIISEKTAHAYLFTGSRGTGKTTCARIFAKTINCPHAKNGMPCLECEICRAADNGTLSDIIEIDAASNTGVDDIRELRESTIYTPELCKYKVYIIDEVHMLSDNAFNALLKIMEEPPEYVKFILATTEVHEVPATILSRCQRFDFRRIASSDIVSRLLYIANEEDINLNENAAHLIAEISDGGMRDALSILDQCVAYSNDVTEESVSDAAGIAGRGYLFDILDCIVEGDSAKAILILSDLYSMSKDMQRLCTELLDQVRNIMLIKVSKSNSRLLTCLPNEKEKIISYSEKLGMDSILKKLDILQACNEKMGRSISPRTELEMSIVKLCAKETVNSASPFALNELIDRVNKLESMLSNPELLKNIAKPIEKTDIEKPKVDLPVEPPQEDAPSNAQQETPIQPAEPQAPTLLTTWNEILDDFSLVNPAVSGSLEGSLAYIYGNYLLIVAQNEFFLTLFKKKENAESLGNIVKNHLGKSYIIKAKVQGGQPKNDTNPIDKLIEKAKSSSIEVEIK